MAQTSLQAFLFTDIVGSTELKRRLGDAEGAKLIAEHDALFRECVARFDGGEQNNPGDGFFATFPVPSAALNCALAFQAALADHRVQARVGIHMGEAVHVPGAGDADKLLGLAVDTAGRVMSLAMPGQILITRHAFDSARQQTIGEHVVWRAHGPYHFKGLDEPLEIHEAGVKGVAPLTPPPDSEKAKRAIAPGDEETLGWRPGAGLDIPGRSGWRLERKLGEGGFGEAWLAISHATKEQRAFKFCFRADRLRSLKRELTLFRLLKETLGERDDIARLYDVRLDLAPFFLEMEYTPEGSLDAYSEDIPLAFVAEVAEALAAAHSVGVLHKDVKPSNILVRRDAQGRPHARLTDFGIGQLIDKSHLEAAQISGAGFTETGMLTDLGSRTGTRMYMAPESLTGKPASTASDVFALGVLLYQMVAGDLNRPLAQGWERDVVDPLLVEDIAACVAGDAEARPAAGVVAQRLRSLDERRRQRAEEQRRARLFGLAKIAVPVLVLLAVAGFIFAGVLNERRRETEQALDEVLRLSDSKKVRDLLDEAEELWPVHPDRTGAMSAWLERARLLLRNRDDHEQALTKLGTTSAEDAWRRQVLADLLVNLERLRTTSGDVAVRWEAARTLRERSIDAHQESWDRTIEAIASSPHYSGLRITPQVGLVPLGADPESGLFEFAHIGSGPIPERNAKTRQLVLSDEFAIVLVLIPGGTFHIGAQREDPDEPNYDPQADEWERPVTLVDVEPFLISKYECTQAQWRQLTGSSPSKFAAGNEFGVSEITPRNPVEMVSWEDCDRELTRHNLVLPTEAQWEYACRAGTDTPWFTGRDVESLANVANISDAYCKANHGHPNAEYESFSDGFSLHAPVGSLAANKFGLFDTHGNIFEWCRDEWHPHGTDTHSERALEEMRMSLLEHRILKGGGYSRIAGVARSAYRGTVEKTRRAGACGFRPARPLTTD